MKTLFATFLAVGGLAGAPAISAADQVGGEFVGSSPFNPTLAAMLEIPVTPRIELIEWKLTLRETEAGQGRYELSYDFGPTVPNIPGLGRERETRIKQGEWRRRSGSESRGEYDLDRAFSLRPIGPDLLHILNRNGSLMMENGGGWSYTLNRKRPPDGSVPPVASDMSYQIAPLARGPGVAAVFEGRTPGHEIAVALGRRDLFHALKHKWRVTLYQDPVTRQPTTYKVEGSMYRRGPREGRWSMERGTSLDPDANVYVLAATPTDGPLLFLQGDERVVFLLDQQRRPLVGDEHFSYTLHRRE